MTIKETILVVKSTGNKLKKLGAICTSVRIEYTAKYLSIVFTDKLNLSN